MSAPINHSYDRHAQIRLTEVATAAAGALIAVEDLGAHVRDDYRHQLDNSIRDLIKIKLILEARIAAEPVIIRKAA